MGINFGRLSPPPSGGWGFYILYFFSPPGDGGLVSFFFLLISSGVDLSLTCPSLREGVWLFSLYSLSLTSSVPLFHPPPFSFFSQFFLITPPFSRWGYTFPLPPYLSLNKFFIRYNLKFYITILYIY